MTVILIIVPLTVLAMTVLLALAIGQTFAAREQRTTQRLASITNLDALAVSAEQSLLHGGENAGGWLLGLVSRFRFRGEDLEGKLQSDLASADLKISPTRFLGLHLVAAVLVFLPVLLATGSPIIAGVGAFAGGLIPRFYVGFRQRRRLKQLEGQLDEAFSMIANALKSGYSFLQSLEAAAKELPAPLSEELFITLRDINVGATVEAAIERLNQRVRSYDLDLVLTAVLIQRRVGGNLSEILDNVSETLRERVRIKGEVATLTAQVRLSGYIIGALPTGLFTLFWITNPSYMRQLVDEPVGRLALMGAIVMQLFGLWAMQKLLAIEV